MTGKRLWDFPIVHSLKPKALSDDDVAAIENGADTPELAECRECGGLECLVCGQHAEDCECE